MKQSKLCCRRFCEEFAERDRMYCEKHITSKSICHRKGCHGIKAAFDFDYCFYHMCENNDKFRDEYQPVSTWKKILRWLNA